MFNFIKMVKKFFCPEKNVSTLTLEFEDELVIPNPIFNKAAFYVIDRLDLGNTCARLYDRGVELSNENTGRIFIDNKDLILLKMWLDDNI